MVAVQSSESKSGGDGVRRISLNASLLSICETMGSSLELHEVLETILRLTVEEMSAQQGSILLLDEVNDHLQMLASIGLPEEIVKKGYIARKGSIAEWVIENQQSLVINDSPKNSEYKPLDEKRRILSALCVPLLARGKVLGTINLNRTGTDGEVFGDADLDTMAILASQAAVAIENSHLHETIIKSERLAAVGQTVAGISHCIKNVLTGVKGGISLIEMSSQAKNWEMNDKGMEILRRNINRLASIVLDMLDYSKEREPSKSDIKINSLATELIASLDSESVMRKIQLENRLEDKQLTVAVDGQQLYRCLLNLMGNAMDAIGEGGKVWITAERSSDEKVLRRLRVPEVSSQAVVIRVGDSGPGISKEHRRNIFEPFFSTKGSKGTGLGLAVTRKIIVEHGGLIEVESPPEESAVFAITLPG